MQEVRTEAKKDKEELRKEVLAAVKAEMETANEQYKTAEETSMWMEEARPVRVGGVIAKVAGLWRVGWLDRCRYSLTASIPAPVA